MNYNIWNSHIKFYMIYYATLYHTIAQANRLVLKKIRLLIWWTVITSNEGLPLDVSCNILKVKDKKYVQGI